MSEHTPQTPVELPQTLRTHIQNPSQYQNMAMRAGSNPLFEKAMDNRIAEGRSHANHVTRTDANYAEDVAYAIKPEIDAISDIDKRIADPMKSAFTVEVDGKMRLGGFESPDKLQVLKKATEADLERNAAIATDIAVKRRMGKMTVRHEVEN